MHNDKQIEDFFSGGPHAVVGASRDRSKYGNKVLRAFLQAQKPAFPVNPGEENVEGEKCFPNLASLPEKVHGISVVTPPRVTEAIIEQAAKLGIHHVWLQPGAESALAIHRAQELQMNIIHSGPCVLVALRYRESADS